MARNLYVYNKLINKANTFYFYGNKSQMFAYMQNYEITHFELNNYRINTSVVKIRFDEDYTILNFDSVSYLIDTDPKNYNYWRCYHVNKIYYQSQYVILEVVLDSWGTYPLYTLSYDAINIKRCNRNIGEGIIDPVNKSYIDTSLLSFDARYMPLKSTSLIERPAGAPNVYYHALNKNEISIVLIVSCVVQDAFAGLEAITQTMPVCVPLSLLLALVDDPNILARYSPIEIAMKIVSGIYSLKTQFWFATNDIKILKAYVAVNDWLDLEYDIQQEAYVSIVANVRSDIFTGTKELNLILLNPSKKYKQFDLTYDNTTILDTYIDKNYKYFAGVINDGIELQLDTDLKPVIYDIIVNYDGMQVVVRQNENALDLSQHFEINLIGSSQSQNALQTMAWFSKQIANVVGDIVGVASNPTPQGMAVSSIKAVANFVGSLVNNTEAKGSVSNNDGAVTFSWQPLGSDYVSYPYMITRRKSYVNEEEHLLFNGANFNVYFDSLVEVFDYDLLGESTINFELTYVKGELINLSNAIPFDAQEEITNLLREGIYIYKYEEQ